MAPVFTRNDLLPLVKKHFGNIDSYQLNYGRHNEEKGTPAMIFMAMLVIIVVALLIFKEISPELFARRFGQIVDRSP